LLLVATLSASAYVSPSTGPMVSPARSVTVMDSLSPVTDVLGVAAFVNVGVVPMDRDTVLMDQTVLVAKGRITAVGPASRIQVPEGAVRIDGRGKFLLPGLSDMHAHLRGTQHIGDLFAHGAFTELSAPETDSAAQVQWLFLWLANGATTIRNVDYVGDASGSSDRAGRLALQFRARAAAGHEWFPHIYTAGQVAPRQYLMDIPSDPPPMLDSIAAYVAAYKAAGYDFIKIHDESPVILDSILAAAKRIGIPVIGHVPPPTQVEHILSGYTSIEHPVNDYLRHGMMAWNLLDTTGIRHLAAAMAHAGVWSDPTQSHYDRLHYIPQVYGPTFTDPPKILKILQDSDVKLLTGTDEPPWIGVLTRELQEFVSAGLTPYQALVASTRNVAEYFGTLDESGTITVGKRADLVLLTGNPLHDVRYTAQPAGVMLGGRWLSRAEIDRRVAAMTLPTVTHGQVVEAPVKSYWSNIADMAVTTAKPVLAGVTLSTAQRTTYQADQAVHDAQWRALLDSLGESDAYGVGTYRVLALIARQLADDHQLLTPEQRALFDPRARAWIVQKAQEGDTLTIRGVQQ
ncbi:MAG TPA: amidohydrolase family protein, partial [Gemmatimonadaceae bacterium]|nr:amidohydrolase family protein [Gemmatimonadaceae bacterium]